jgi:hypothetical protein
MNDGTGLAEKMLGMPALVVLEVEDVPGEVVVRAESTRTKATCPSCRRRAQAHDRVEVHLRDLHCFGRPTRLVIRKRRWRCRTTGCIKKTWTEKLAGIAARQVLTTRAGAEVTRQVGALCRSVASVATEYGVGSDTAWAAVELHGRPLVDDPKRVGPVRALGVDEHSYLSATPEHSTIYATALVDLDRRIMIDLFEGKSGSSEMSGVHQPSPPSARGSFLPRNGTLGAVGSVFVDRSLSAGICEPKHRQLKVAVRMAPGGGPGSTGVNNGRLRCSPISRTR